MTFIGKRNPGKVFEECFIKSVPEEYCWHKRLNDNAASWGNGFNTRFASDNECDFLLFDCRTRTLSALELKTTQDRLTFWRKDFDKDGKKHTYNIKKNQILGLMAWNKYLMNCGFVINFRNNDNRTFFIPIDTFVSYTDDLEKKSINMNDVLDMDPIEIDSYKLKVNYRYDVPAFLQAISI